jgi:hypothetical protein
MSQSPPTAPNGAPKAPSSNKEDLRSEIEDQVKAFLERGGAVHAVAPGTSGRDAADTPLSTFRSFAPRPREERTYVPEVVAAIEARRRKPKPARKTASAKPVLVKRAVYDDFGEPLRYEWVEQPPSSS